MRNLYNEWTTQLDAGETVTFTSREQAATFQRLLRLAGHDVDESTARSGLSFVLTRFDVIEVI